jgi:hypothetical protein
MWPKAEEEINHESIEAVMKKIINEMKISGINGNQHE